jgi:hypothetical protein
MDELFLVYLPNQTVPARAVQEYYDFVSLGRVVGMDPIGLMLHDDCSFHVRD